MCALVLMLAFGAVLLIIGIIQGYLTTAIFGGLVLAFVVWALVSAKGHEGDEDSDYADDSEA
ncbi:hypothetical protein [Streptomyces sp. NBC_00038]|uniref:hypothetical protein n=1 Tax=Streptomyces sp. NBC_00038 TaxID=2903615 RepID=UPI00225B01C5|nr:hypothetical protein [Streptomyces sp. NBC_00038]MCX5562377.1 hypothetical protein [Streptomyces sp. NBC_00038]